MMEAVQEFLRQRGGRVRQMDLIDHFMSESGGLTGGEEGRALVRGVVDAAGVVKVEDGVKYVYLSPEDAETTEQLNGDAVASSTEDKTMANGNKASGSAHTSGSAAAAPGGAEVRLRDRRRRESAPVIGLHDPDHPTGLGQQVRAARRVSRGSQRAVLTSCLSEDSALEGLDGFDVNTPKGSRRNFIELMMSSSPQVRRSMIHRGTRYRDSLRSDGDAFSLLSSTADDDCASVTLDPLEHEWMLCASDGLWESLQPLLAVEPGLLVKRDFVTGFTCLHWAAKQGNARLLAHLLDFAKNNGVCVNVNVRSSAGYTPLHLAAMHGHTQVVRELLSDWDADPEVRDYSGRRAIQYLPAPLDLQDKVTSPGSDPEGGHGGGGGGVRGWRLPKVLQGNLNRLLNPPAEASQDSAGRAKVQRKSSLSRLNARLHRGRPRAQIIHSASLRDCGEVANGEELPVSPVRTRPLSNLFG